MARGRAGGLPPRRAGPALHTNRAQAGGREEGLSSTQRPPLHQTWPVTPAGASPTSRSA